MFSVCFVSNATDWTYSTTFVLFADVIKRCEQKYQIITQDLKMKNVWETINRNKRETMRNIICKTNEKMGGVNYSLTCTDKRFLSQRIFWKCFLISSIQDMICDGTLFVGLGVSHPGAVSNLDRMRQDKKRDDGKQVVPSVIGVSFEKIQTKKVKFIKKN